MKKENLDLAIKLRHELHQNPEISNKEKWTKRHLINFLRKNTNLEIIDKGLWFYAVYRSEEGRKNIAFRADFDAIEMDESIDLPYGSQNSGISHKCGHDGHSATMAAFALEIDQKGSDNNIFFLFQHAEEIGTGAKLAVELIKEENIDEIFAYHNESGIPFKSINVIDETAHYASKGMIIHMEGTPSHASEPEKGKNPSFAIAKIIDAIPALTSDEKNKGKVFCTIIQVDIGKRAFGIQASKGKLLLTIRAFYEEEMDKLEENIKSIAIEEAKKYGLKVNFSFEDYFPETVNNKESNDKIRKVAKENDLELLEIEEASRGSEDYGYYTKETKGSIFYIGNGEDYPNIHSYEYDFRDELIEIGVKMFKGLSNL
ncbi:MAG: amidohydrolase [Bacillota bacterium]|nr:amidohydrolase [Bacillota bacterium]